MAFTAASYDRAEWTFVYDTAFPGELRPLPWAYLQLGDAGEERKYVVPLSGASRLNFTPYRQKAEFAPNAPFPLDSARFGATGVHYFGSGAV